MSGICRTWPPHLGEFMSCRTLCAKEDERIATCAGHYAFSATSFNAFAEVPKSKNRDECEDLHLNDRSFGDVRNGEESRDRHQLFNAGKRQQIQSNSSILACLATPQFFARLFPHAPLETPTRSLRCYRTQPYAVPHRPRVCRARILTSMSEDNDGDAVAKATTTTTILEQRSPCFAEICRRKPRQLLIRCTDP